MIEIILSNQFRKDIKLAKKRGLNITLLETVVNMLANEKNYRINTETINLLASTKIFANAISNLIGC